MNDAVDIIQALLAGPEVKNDPLVRAHLTAWNRGGVSAAECLLRLILDQSRDRKRLVDQAVDLAMNRPFHPDSPASVA